LENEVTILADLLRTIFERSERRSNAEFDQDKRSITELCDALIATTSETSALIIANKVLNKYSNLDDDEKLSFFQDVSTRMSIDPERVREALKDYEKLPSRETYQNFSDVLISHLELHKSSWKCVPICYAWVKMILDCKPLIWTSSTCLHRGLIEVSSF
jgi:hypothetical protein